MTGSPSAFGFVRKSPVYTQPGDNCEVDIERIGMLRNAIGREAGGQL